MYNVISIYKNFGYKIDKLMWADSLKSLLRISILDKKNLEIKIFYDTKINKKETALEKIKEKSKPSRGFLFITMKDKHLFISNLRRIYFSLTNTYLKIESVK